MLKLNVFKEKCLKLRDLFHHIYKRLNEDNDDQIIIRTLFPAVVSGRERNTSPCY